MDMILLTATDRAEIAALYIAHLGESDFDPDEIELCPIRCFMIDLLKPFKPGRQFLTAEELLTCLQVTLYQRDNSPGYYTGGPALHCWLEDEKGGWPALCVFLDRFNPPWFRDYVKTLDEAAQAAEDSDQQETHASMQGVAEACKDRNST